MDSRQERDWPQIPELKIDWKKDDSGFSASVLVDLGILGKWSISGLEIREKEILDDPELLKEAMESSEAEVQVAFGRLLLKAAALILVKRGDGLGPMEGWYMEALRREKRRDPPNMRDVGLE